jgi:predicted Fe-S protein YdhL (DUF1289 family)
MMEVVETADWKKMKDEDREKLVKGMYTKLLQKGISNNQVKNPTQ